MVVNTALWKRFENSVLNEGISKNRRRKLKVVYNIISRELDLENALQNLFADQSCLAKNGFTLFPH